MSRIIGAYFVLVILFIIPGFEYILAAGPDVGEYLDRKGEIWGLFYRMMSVAFLVGAVVSGTMIWLIWRFRESHPKATPTRYEGTGETDR